MSFDKVSGQKKFQEGAGNGHRASNITKRRYVMSNTGMRIMTVWKSAT
jgi:hypothetical protein